MAERNLKIDLDKMFSGLKKIDSVTVDPIVRVEWSAETRLNLFYQFEDEERQAFANERRLLAHKLETESTKLRQLEQMLSDLPVRIAAVKQSVEKARNNYQLHASIPEQKATEFIRERAVRRLVSFMHGSDKKILQ